jgi:LmbE family N-acetylglucosaminyl deacetylase
MRSIAPSALFSSLPIVGIEQLTGNNPAMILAPHPDDESLGCGGLIAESCMSGNPPVVVIATDGTGSHPSSVSFPPPRLRRLREQEARDAVSALGLPPGRLHFLGLPDGDMPTTGFRYDIALNTIVWLFRHYACRTLFAPWLHDPHSDHEAAQQIARVVATEVNARLLSYPIWGWLLPDTPNASQKPITGWRFGIGQHISAKRTAIQSHRSQYSGLITDDPGAFSLPVNLLSAFDQPFETFLDTPL